jgi:hypothetical protein
LPNPDIFKQATLKIPYNEEDASMRNERVNFISVPVTIKSGAGIILVALIPPFSMRSRGHHAAG